MWSAARILIGVGLGAGGGLDLFKFRTRAEAEDDGTAMNLDKLRQCPYLHWDWNWDRRATLKKPKNGQPEIDEKQHSAHSRHIVCVSSGLCYKLAGSTITGLQKEGRLQVVNLTKTLMNSRQHFRNIYYSPIQQDRETAEMIFEGTSTKQPTDPPKLILEELLKEGPTVVPIPLTSAGLPDRGDLFQDHIKIEAAFRKIFHRLDKSDTEDVFDVVVAQPDVIKYFICRALQLPPEAYSRFQLNWASITWFTISGSGVVTAFTIGDSGYQPPVLLAAK